MYFAPQFNSSHRKLLQKLYSPSCELQRTAEEGVNNQQRHKEWLSKSASDRYKSETNNYKDKKVCSEYEYWLDHGRG